MNNLNTIEICVRLLEEGVPTLKLTTAEILGGGKYRILASEDYDSEDEIWEFVPGSVVRAMSSQTDDGEDIFLAVGMPISRDELLKQNEGKKIVVIYVLCDADGKKKNVKTEAVELGGGLYRVLPSLIEAENSLVWEFFPGSIVKAVNKKDDFGEEVLFAFDQLREDRVNL